MRGCLEMGRLSEEEVKKWECRRVWEGGPSSDDELDLGMQDEGSECLNVSRGFELEP
jgi:hypothetical protein